ncbi:MAG: filamentous hemagglutinin N-terminal domain-containing protein, partial [Pseudomonadota bacterium]
MRAPSLMHRFLASTSLIALAIAAGAPEVLANPKGAKIVAGKASVRDRGNGRLEVQQSSNKAVIDWRSFSIDQHEHTQFNQPSRNAVALNRVTGGASSRIAGQLSANGRIILLNPNGILFTKTAKVDVAGLIASTSHLNTKDFLADRYHFTPSGNPQAQVINRGSITVRNGGLAALVSPWVENSGIINARLGKVVLASGEAFTADLWGDGLVKLHVTDESHVRGISHTGEINAEGGIVALSVAEASALVDRAVNMDGVVEATRVAQVGGRIVLEGGDGGSVMVAGDLDASGQEQTDQGGEITIAAGRVELAGSASLDVSGPTGGGEVRIGGAFQGAPPIPGVKPAREVLVAEGARIDADATVEGDGGMIVAWSDHTTRFSGTATARGGPEGGDGGLIETSGKELLSVASATIDSSASSGNAGTWLLDPRDVRIVEDPAGRSASFINANDVSGALSIGTSVTIETSDPQIVQTSPPQLAEGVRLIPGPDNQGGSITVEASIVKNGGQDSKLTLRADEDIRVFRPIVDLSDSKLSVEFDAGDDVQFSLDGSSGGVVDVSGDVEIVSRGLDAVRTGDPDEPLSVDRPTISVNTNAVLTELGGITHDGGIIADGNVTISMRRGGRIELDHVAITAGGNVEATVGGQIDDGATAEIYIAEDGIKSSGDVEITMDVSGAGGGFVLLENNAIVAAGDVGIDTSDWFSPAFFTIGEGTDVANVADGVPELRSEGDIKITARRVEIETGDGTIDDPLEIAGSRAGDSMLTVVSRGEGQNRLIAIAEVDSPESGSSFDEVDLTLAGDFSLDLDLEGVDGIALTDTGFERLTTAENDIHVRLRQENTDGVTVLGSVDTGEGDLTIVAAGGIDGSRDGDAPPERIQGNDILLTSTSDSVGIALDRVDATSLTANSVSTLIQGDISTDGEQRYQGRTVIVGARQLTADTGDVVFEGDVQAASEQISIPGPHGLSVAAGGDVEFNAPVGSSSPLALLDVAAANIEINDAVIINARGPLTPTTIDDLTITSVVTSGNGPLTVAASNDLTVAANVTNGDGILSLSAGRDLRVTSTVTSGGGNDDILAGRNLLVTGAIMAGEGNVALGAGNDIRLGRVETSGTASIVADAGVAEGEPDGVGAIVAVAGATPNVEAQTVLLGAATGVGTDVSPLRTEVASMSAGNREAGGIHVREIDDLTVESVSMAALGQELMLTVDNGEIALPPLADLSSLAVTANAISTQGVSTDGEQTYTAGSIELAGTYQTAGGAFTADGPVDLVAAQTTINTVGAEGNGAVTFEGTIDGTTSGANSLSVESGGEVGFAGAVGGGTPLGALQVDGTAITLNDVTTQGEEGQTYRGNLVVGSTFLTNGGNFLADGPVVLSDAETIVDTRAAEGSDGTITFAGPITGTSAGANSLILRSGGANIEAQQTIGEEGVPLDALVIDTDFVPAAPLPTRVSATAGERRSIRIEVPDGEPEASPNREVRVSGLADLPDGTQLSDGETTITIPTGSDEQTFGSVDALTIRVPAGVEETFSFDLQIADVDPDQVTLPTGANLQVVSFEPGVGDASNFTVTATVRTDPPRLPPSANAADVSVYLDQGLDFAIPNGQPARQADYTPVVPSAPQIVAQILQLDTLIEPAGPTESAESKAAREERAELQEALANTYDPWEACPEVGAVSTAWQNTPSDAAFNQDPTMLPYSVDVFCGGYQFAGPSRGTADRDYGGLTWVNRDLWTDQ